MKNGESTLSVEERLEKAMLLLSSFIATLLCTPLAFAGKCKDGDCDKKEETALAGKCKDCDKDKDGLEESAELFWENKGRIVAPIGMALTPPKSI
mgnify:CR=1 FL=1